jgi:WD40 repeat protein
MAPFISQLTKTYTVIISANLQKYGVDAVAFSPDGTKIASGSPYKASLLIVWSASTGEYLCHMKNFSLGEIEGEALCPVPVDLLNFQR